MAIFVIFITLVEIVWSIYSVVKVIKKQKLEQMKYFSEDLQGALDCVKYAQISRYSMKTEKMIVMKKQIKFTFPLDFPPSLWYHMSYHERR